jgi:hypothetical protein
MAHCPPVPREFVRRLVFSLAIAAVVAAAYRLVVHRDAHVTAPNRDDERKRLGIGRQPVVRPEPEPQDVVGAGLDALVLPQVGPPEPVAPVSPVRNARTGPRRHSTRPSRGAIFAILGLVVLVGGVLAFSGFPHRQSGAALIDGPSPTSAPAVAGIPSSSPSPEPAPSATLVAATAPAVEATPRPTPKPTPKPTPRPTPKPTPKPYCRVPKLVGVATNKGTGIWSNAGFTSSINFSPDVPPHYTITSQSRSAGTSITCSSGITVYGTP